MQFLFTDYSGKGCLHFKALLVASDYIHISAVLGWQVWRLNCCSALADWKNEISQKIRYQKNVSHFHCKRDKYGWNVCSWLFHWLEVKLNHFMIHNIAQCCNASSLLVCSADAPDTKSIRNSTMMIVQHWPSPHSFIHLLPLVWTIYHSWYGIILEWRSDIYLHIFGNYISR